MPYAAAIADDEPNPTVASSTAPSSVQFTIGM
jgi:hypothetical protein